MKHFIAIAALLLLTLSCSRDLTNPLDTDADLNHRPLITNIQIINDQLVLRLDFAYSGQVVILFERKLLDAFEPIVCQPLTASTFADNTLDLELNHELAYRVRISKGGYTTEYSPEKLFSYQSTIINAPSGFSTTTIELQGVRMTWQDNSSIETGYRIENNEDNSGFTELANLPANTSSYLHAITGMPPTPINLSYRIKSINNTLNSIWVENSVTYSGLGAPTDLAITDSTASHLTIAWTRNSSIATGYEIERKKDNGSFALLQTVAASVQSYSDVITEVGTYAYRVRAKKDNIHSTYSNEVTAQIHTILPTDGLIAYYPFNGSANDESGNGRNCTTYGAVLSMDRFGYANTSYEFDGIDDYLSSSSTGLPTAERTTSLWFFANSLLSNPASVLFGYGGLDTFSWTGASWFMFVGSSRIGVACHCDSPVTPYYNYGYSLLAEWQSLIAKTSSLGTQVYLNGELVASNGTFVNNTIVTNKNMTIGVCVGAYGEAPFTNPDVTYFHGKIDDVRIYNRALTEAEIQALYHEGGWTGN